MPVEGFAATKPVNRGKSNYDAVTSIIAWIIEVTSGLLFFFSLCIAVYEVFMRYVFKEPHDWGDELSLMAMLFSVFLAACLALREGQMTIVDIVPQMLKPRSRAILELMINFVTTITCALFGWSGFLTVQMFFIRGSKASSSLQIPFWFVYVVLPLSMGLCTLVGIESIFKLVAKISARRQVS